MEIVYLPLTPRELDHELRNPLTGILGLARLLEDLLLTPEQRSYVQGIIEEGDKLVQLAETLSQTKSLSRPASIVSLEQVSC